MDKSIHDKQHGWSSLAGGIAGLCIFITYYFFTRVESMYAPSKKVPGTSEPTREFSWNMPWWYFVVGAVLFSFVGAAVACTLSTATRPRFLCMKNKKDCI